MLIPFGMDWRKDFRWSKIRRRDALQGHHSAFSLFHFHLDAEMIMKAGRIEVQI